MIHLPPRPVLVTDTLLIARAVGEGRVSLGNVGQIFLFCESFV